MVLIFNAYECKGWGVQGRISVPLGQSIQGNSACASSVWDDNAQGSEPTGADIHPRRADA